MLERLLTMALVGILTMLIRRQLDKKDARDVVRGEMYREMLERFQKAEGWEENARDAPDGGATLRVRDDADPIRLPGEDPHPGRGTP